VKYIIIILTIVFVHTSNAQNYPINVNLNVNPPYSPYVPDYFDIGSNKVMVTMLLKDLTSPPIDVYLKVRIIGTGIQAVSNPIQSGAQSFVNLTPGGLITLSSSQVAEYFNFSNLQLSGSEVDKITSSNAFTEGVYQICVTAYERNRQVQLSAEVCATIWITTHQPPQLVFPSNVSNQTILTPQLLPFSWNKLHTDFPGSLGTEYTFELFEVPNGRNPQEIALTMPPVFTEKTDFLTLPFDASKPSLNIGTRYAWRVTASDKSGKPYFRNNGQSEVWSFIYGDEERIIVENPNWNVSADNIKTSSVRIFYDAIPNNSIYKVEYRKKGSLTWYSDNVQGLFKNVGGLQPSTTYEYRITNNNNPSRTSITQEFTTKPKTTPNCGVDSNSIIDCTNKISSTTPGAIWDYNGFELQVLEISSSSSSNFNGTGFMTIPFLAGLRIPVKFTNIAVNTELTVCSGQAEAISKGLDAFIQGQWSASTGGGGTFTGTMITTTKTVKWVAIDYSQTPPVIVVTFPNGSTQTYPFEPGHEVLITDAMGNVWKIDANGNITQGTQGSTVLASEDAKDVIKKVLEFHALTYTEARMDASKSDLDLKSSSLPSTFPTLPANGENLNFPFELENNNESTSSSGAANIQNKQIIINYYIAERKYNLDLMMYVISSYNGAKNTIFNFAETEYRNKIEESVGKFFEIYNQPIALYIDNQLKASPPKTKLELIEILKPRILTIARELTNNN
jgi:hypothetical protein